MNAMVARLGARFAPGVTSPQGPLAFRRAIDPPRGATGFATPRQALPADSLRVPVRAAGKAVDP